MLRLFVSILFLPSWLFCQEYSPVVSFGDFSSATAMSINNSGMIFITDDGKDEVYSFDSLGKGFKTIGGYGWDESSFADPVDIFATSLNVYVSDFNNHRIQFFDKDLNYIGQINTRESENREMQFGYPLSCAVSNQGDLYILDSENKRVLEFDMFGNFLSSFGGNDAGNFVLENPSRLTIYNNLIFVLDGNKIFVFDQYGNNLNKFENLPIAVNDINVTSEHLLLIGSKEIYSLNLNNTENTFEKINIPEFDAPEIISAQFHKNKLYVLTSYKVYILAQI